MGSGICPTKARGIESTYDIVFVIIYLIAVWQAYSVQMFKGVCLSRKVETLYLGLLSKWPVTQFADIHGC